MDTKEFRVKMKREYYKIYRYHGFFNCLKTKAFNYLGNSLIDIAWKKSWRYCDRKSTSAHGRKNRSLHSSRKLFLYRSHRAFAMFRHISLASGKIRPCLAHKNISRDIVAKPATQCNYSPSMKNLRISQWFTNTELEEPYRNTRMMSRVMMNGIRE